MALLDFLVSRDGVLDAELIGFLTRRRSLPTWPAGQHGSQPDLPHGSVNASAPRTALLTPQAKCLSERLLASGSLLNRQDRPVPIAVEEHDIKPRGLLEQF